MAEGVDREALLPAPQAPPTVSAAAARALYRITGQSSGDPAIRPVEEARAIQSRWLRWHENLETGGNATSSSAAQPE